LGQETDTATPTREVFAQPELLRRTFVKPPQVTRLAQAWSDLGIPPDVMTVDGLVECVVSAAHGAQISGVRPA